jgi:deoxyribodipyrimidine photo-lyase
MYYHLLDADWASNACSWQWVVGSFSSKKYYANQENINNYSGTKQRGTYLDRDYSILPSMPVPEELKDLTTLELKTNLPSTSDLVIDNSLPIYLYNMYNLDPQWDKHINANRILLIEPSFFSKYPISDKVISFIISLANNIPDIQIFVGEFDELSKKCMGQHKYYKEHSSNKHYTGIEIQREWIFPEVQGYHPSFFNYWKKCEKYLNNLYEERKFTN